MKYFAVLDTNVLVSAMLRVGSVPGHVAEEAMNGDIIPVLNDEILAEYEEVLRSTPKRTSPSETSSRQSFHICFATVRLPAQTRHGRWISPISKCITATCFSLQLLIGSAGKSSAGTCPTRWTPIPSSSRLETLSLRMEHRKFSTATKAASSPATSTRLS